MSMQTFTPTLEQLRRAYAVHELFDRFLVATGRRPKVIIAAPCFFRGVNPIECCGVKIQVENIAPDTIMARKA